MDYSGLEMAGASGSEYFCPDRRDLIELPPGSELFVLPGRLPVGIDPNDGEPALLESDPFSTTHKKVQAVAAFVAPAHTTCYSAAYQSNANAPILPLFAYTAVGWADGKFWAACFRSDPDRRQDIDQFDQEKIEKNTRRQLKTYKDNRLIQHLGKCCLTYGCPAARNYFLGRWEAPLPTSPICNANCLGCISLQPSGCCPATQDRIRFVPTAAEIAEIAINHLQNAPRPIVSFGQGCEGEPLLQTKTIKKAIRLIREKTARGTINLNSNAGLPEAVAELADNGLDSIRVSLNSVAPRYHQNYYRPKGFTLNDVIRSMQVMKRYNRHLSLNYFILPGFTDDPAETEHLVNLIAKQQPDLIQLRNLNMDPEYYLRSIDFQPTGSPLGIRKWHSKLKKLFPDLKFGYFNPPLR